METALERLAPEGVGSGVGCTVGAVAFGAGDAVAFVVGTGPGVELWLGPGSDCDSGIVLL